MIATPADLAGLLATVGAGRTLFALLDGSRNGSIYDELVSAPNASRCLFKGRLEPALEAAAPWLVELASAEDPLCRYLLERGWGDSWGVFVAAEVSLDDLRRHLRSLLRVRLEGGPKVLFRFFDPRVLRVYLPTCTPEELEAVFGPVYAFVLEGRDPRHALSFVRGDDGLVSETHAAGGPALTDEEAVAQLLELRQQLRAAQPDDEAAWALSSLRALAATIQAARPTPAAPEGTLERGLARLVHRLERRPLLTPRAVSAGVSSLLVELRTSSARLRGPAASS